MKPLISILIPVYNVEKYLERCLTSVCAQTIQNVEIVIVNDGSTDNSGKIIEQFISKDHRIKVIHQENQGQSGARNTAISNATGEFISFVDADDWIAPEMLEKCYNRAIITDSEIIMCNMSKAKSITEVLPNESLPEYSTQLNHENFSRIVYAYLFEYPGASLCNKLFKSSLIKKYDCNSVRVPLGEDMILMIKLLSFMPKISYLDESLYYYYVNDSSITHKYAERQIGQFALGIEEIIQISTNNRSIQLVTELLPLIVFRGFSTALFNSYAYNHGFKFLEDNVYKMMDIKIYKEWIGSSDKKSATRFMKSKGNKVHTDIVLSLLSRRHLKMVTFIEWIRFILITRRK